MPHPNARLTTHGRMLLADRIRAGWTITAAARAAGISRQTSSKWWDRAREPGTWSTARVRSITRLVASGRTRRSPVCCRLAYAEELSDESPVTTAGFLERAWRFYAAHGITIERILTDNGGCYRSRDFAIACDELGIGHRWTRPYRPHANGKARAAGAHPVRVKNPDSRLSGL